MASTHSHAGTAAIVVTRERGETLRVCLESLGRQTLPFARIFVVENGPPRATPDFVRTPMSGMETIALPRNMGFAGGVNAGLRCVLDDDAIQWIALINDDVRLEPTWHEQAMAALAAQPRAGSCATCLVKQSDPSLIDTAGMAWQAPGWADNHLSGRPVTEADGTAHDVFGACAAAALYRRAFFEEVGWLDETLFAYQEDVDLALRAALHGWCCVMAPHARGTHAGFGSNRRFPLGGTYADYYNARNRLYVLVKAWPGDAWRRHGRRVLKRLALSVFRSVPEGRMAAVWTGTAHGVIRLPRAVCARKRLLASTAVKGDAPS